MTEFPDIPGGRIAYDISGAGPLVLLAHGLGDMRQDPVFPRPQTEVGAIAATLPAGTTVTMIDGGGHHPHAQFPTQVAAAITPILTEHARTGPDRVPRTGGKHDPSSAPRGRRPGRAGPDAGDRDRRVPSPPPRLTPPKSYYLALGDSIAYGFQTSKALAGLPPDAFNTGYADLFAARLRQLRPHIATVNYSCPGESTITFRQPCIWKTSGHALHNDYPGSRLGAALAFLAAHRGTVSPITLSLNGNDANDFLHTCPPGDLACLQASAPAAIAAYQARLTSILRYLRAAAPDAEIIVVGAYDPNIGAFAFADPLFTQLNQAQRAAAATVRARFADPFPVFNPQGDPAAETTAICTLTLLCSQADATPPTPATARSRALSGPHQATRACGDHVRRPAARKAAAAWAQNRCLRSPEPATTAPQRTNSPPAPAGGSRGHQRRATMPAERLIFAGVSGSPGSVHALRYAADLARHHDAILVPLLTWVPPRGDLDERKHPSLQLRELWKDDAWQRLRAALDTAFGGSPPGVRTWPLVLRGKPGQVMASAARQAGDLLVIGTGRRGPLARLAGCRVSRYCLHHAQCPVLAIPPPALARQAGHGLRGWAFRHRGLDPDNAGLPAGTS